MTRWIIVTLLFIVFIWVAIANAHPMACGKHDVVVAGLKIRFAERIHSMGISKGGGSIVELLVSEKGTWTVLIVTPEGRACMIGSGDGWQKMEGPGT